MSLDDIPSRPRFPDHDEILEDMQRLTPDDPFYDDALIALRPVSENAGPPETDEAALMHIWRNCKLDEAYRSLVTTKNELSKFHRRLSGIIMNLMSVALKD